ncbi:hypothetical protein T35B1_11597 [Salinisphaera shabanensis T35B1]|uniref:hypothetical protein n=1 Tax=Salinisphaera TaxID=180541 RepID=UPI00334063ED
MTASNQTVLLGFNDEGEAIQYRKLSARLPEFLAAYPPSEGYQVRIDYLDPIEAKPGLNGLYQAAISGGHNPTDIGLPAIAGNTMIFRAQLLNPDDKIISSGSALVLIQDYKDWEKGETAARQRLLASLGFGGDVLDDDEDRDQRGQGFRPTSVQTASQPPQPASASVVPIKGNKEPAPANVEPPVESTSQTPPSASGNTIPQALVRQIEHQCALKGVDVPEYSTPAEAKAALKRLIQS